jgi:hypothetical protein
MNFDELAKRLTDRGRIGLNEELAKKLRIPSADAGRGRMLAEQEEARGHLQVSLLGCFVVNDTDLFTDGEIYWWSIPALIDASGKTHPDPFYLLPNAMPPHRCGDQEWMSNLSLGEPPLLAVIPPGDDAQSLVIRLGIYDDDWAPAKIPEAMTAGLEALAALGDKDYPNAEAISGPVRNAIFDSLKAKDDDILIEQDLVLRKGDASQFGAGMIGSVVTSMARAYYFVRDTVRTKQFGPVTLHKGQSEQVRFDVPFEQGGRLSLFARGHDVTCPTFGDLGVEQPFFNRVLTRHQASELANGVTVTGSGPAKLVAYYTPSYGHSR